MTKKISAREFIDSLIKKSGKTSDEAFGESLGVKKQTVGYWKSEKVALPYDLLLKFFGPETMEFLQAKYELARNPKMDIENDAVIKSEAEKIQLLFDRGLVRCNCGNHGTFSDRDSSTRAERSGRDEAMSDEADEPERRSPAREVYERDLVA